MGCILDKIVVTAFTVPLDIHLFSKVLDLERDSAMRTNYQCSVETIHIQRFVLVLSLLRHIRVYTGNQLRENH